MKWRKGHHRFLKNNGYPAAADRLKFWTIWIQRGDVGACVADWILIDQLSGGDSGVCRQNSHNGLGRDGFTRAGFANQGYRAAGLDIEINTMKGLDFSGRHPENDAKIAHT